jgi:hypothetical protein
VIALLLSLAVTAVDCKAEAATTVTRQGALADIDVVEHVVANGYAGYDATVDWKAVFANMRAAVGEDPGPRPVFELQDAWIAALRPARDNHLALYAPKPNGNRWRGAGDKLVAYVADVELDRADAADCQGLGLQRVLRDPARGVRWSPVVMASAPPEGVRCGANGEVLHSVRPLRQGKVDAGVPFERDGPVLRLRTLANGQRAKLLPFTQATPAPDAPYVVLDVRGNRGGSDWFLSAWFKPLFAGSFRYGRVERLDTPVTRQGEGNALQCQLGFESVGDRLAHIKRQLELLRESLRKSSARVWHARTAVYDGTAEDTFAGRVVVLTDAGCASACETAVNFARQLPNHLIVGTNTAGVGKFGEGMPFRLPNTGLWINVPRKRFVDNPPEGRGRLPDIWLDTTDPLPAVHWLATRPTPPSAP